MLVLHVLCSLLSYAAFLVAFIAGMLFLVQERQLKRKRMGVLFHRLPSLSFLDRTNFLMISSGFWFLSAGLAFGLIGTRLWRGRWWTGDPKEYLTVTLWGAYCVLWLVRLRSTLRGRRVALLSILGFGFVLAAFAAVSWLVPSWHSLRMARLAGAP